MDMHPECSDRSACTKTTVHLIGLKCGIIQIKEVLDLTPETNWGAACVLSSKPATPRGKRVGNIIGKRASLRGQTLSGINQDLYHHLRRTSLHFQYELFSEESYDCTRRSCSVRKQVRLKTSTFLENKVF